MISSLIDAVLLSALAATSVCVLMMYRRLKRFDALQSEAAKAFVRSSQALENARAALEALHEHGGEMAVSLAARLNEARLVLNEIEDGVAKRTRRARQEEAEIERRRAEVAASAPPPMAPDVDFMHEWTDRFTGLGNANRARPRGPARATPAVRAPITIDAGAASLVETAPLAPSQSLSLTWRALANAAQRAG